jgi:sugar phosphate isomerase/epimerase
MATLAVCSWSLTPASPEELAHRLKSLGIPQTQLALVPCCRDAAWHDAVARLRGAGIGIVSGMMAFAGEDYSTLESIALTGGVRLDERWSENLDRAFACAELAAKSGIELVTFHAGFIPHESGALRQRMLDRLRTIADIFGQRAIGLALETGQESAVTLASALDELDRPSVGVNFDPANMLLYGMGDPVEAIALLAPRVRQVHIKDARRSESAGQWGDELPVGTGQVRWEEFLPLATGIDLVIEREAGNARDSDIVRARDLVRRLVPTIR